MSRWRSRPGYESVCSAYAWTLRSITATLPMLRAACQRRAELDRSQRIARAIGAQIVEHLLALLQVCSLECEHVAGRRRLTIRNGKIVAMGNIKGDSGRVIDATGCTVAPGFMDIHTHYDAALTGWDPYATLSGWHGVTSVAIGNCGFGFAPVRSEDQERAMLRMERTETIPLSIMQASMRWDWETFPEFLDSLERHKVGVNTASLVPYSPLRAWVMGNDEARDPNYTASSDQIAQLKHVLREALQAGGFGFSGSFSMSNRDYDGGYLPTQVAPREELLGMAEVMRE